MKRLTALLLTCALFAAALTACAQHGTDSTSSSAAPSPLSQDALAQPTYPKLASYPNEKDYVKANGDLTAMASRPPTMPGKQISRSSKTSPRITRMA